MEVDASVAVEGHADAYYSRKKQPDSDPRRQNWLNGHGLTGGALDSADMQA